jgi:hypothetical protein
MTWTYETDDSTGELVVYDHTGQEVKRTENDGTGFSIPADIRQAMCEELDACGTGGPLAGAPDTLDNPGRYRAIMLDFAAGNIEPKGDSA